MARIEGMSPFFLSRRSYGRVITPARVYALDSRLLLAIGLMEEVQEWAKQTRAPVKQLARMLVAWRVGCPWCLDFGTRTSEKLGVTDEQLRALSRPTSRTSFRLPISRRCSPRRIAS